MIARKKSPKRPVDPVGLQSFDPGRLGRLSWLGLAVAGLGWLLLLGAAGIADVVAVKMGHPMAPTFHADLVDISKALIGSGFGLAVLGGLQAGFGALNRFFEAVLNRSAAPRPAPAPQKGAGMMDRDAQPLRERRNYHINADGSVEVETIVGTRLFASMHEARDFI